MLILDDNIEFYRFTISWRSEKLLPRENVIPYLEKLGLNYKEFTLEDKDLIFKDFILVEKEHPNSVTLINKYIISPRSNGRLIVNL